MTLTSYEWAARQFEPRQRRYRSPLALGRHLDPAIRTSAALDLVDRNLVDLADHHTGHDSLAVFIAPQEGKSSLVARRFPEWLLEDNPALRIAIVSYEFETAVRWGRDIRRDIDLSDGDLRISLREDSRAAGRWETPQGGGVYCVGVGGPLSGRAVDVLLVDDPVKDRADAESSRMRDRAWEWWESVALTRLAPGGIICLIQTRWHCLLPGTDILTNMGLVPIEAITSENSVVTSAGMQEVQASATKPHTGDVIALTAYGYPKPVRMTPEHRVMTADGWRQAGELRPLDWLAFPIPQGETSLDDLRAMIPPRPVSTAKAVTRLTGQRIPVTKDALAAHLQAGLTYQQISTLYGRKTRTSAFEWATLYGLTRPVDNVLAGDPAADPDFWRIIGYWLAEGDVTAGREGGARNVVRWSFGPSERHLTEDVTEVLGRYGLLAKTRLIKGARGLSVKCSSAQLARFLDGAGHGAHHKRLPEQLVMLPADLARELIRGYWIGDGTVTPVDGTMNHGWARITSVSLDLLMGFYRLLPRLGVAASIMKGGAPRLPKYELRFPMCDAPWLGNGTRTIRQHSVKIDGDRLLVKIKRLDVEEYDGPVYDIQTPAHDFVAGNFLVHNCDDLSGRVLSRPSARKWQTIRIPAIAEDNDPLGRQPGEELVSARGREPGYFLALRAAMSPYVFSGIYQQSPTVAEGNFFRRASFRYWRQLESWSDGRERLDLEGRTVTLADCWRFGTVDVAASTKTTADYTVISIWAVTPEGDLVLLDRAREQVAEHDHFALAQPLFERWGQCQLFVERHFFATTLITDAQAAGVPVAEVTADTDKVTRAIPAAARVHSGRVWFPAAAEWLDTWTSELAEFPSGSHDDQVDTLSYAARVLTAEWTPPTSQPRRGVDPHERAVALAAGSAIGSGEVDLMNVPY